MSLFSFIILFTLLIFISDLLSLVHEQEQLHDNRLTKLSPFLLFLVLSSCKCSRSYYITLKKKARKETFITARIATKFARPIFSEKPLNSFKRTISQITTNNKANACLVNECRTLLRWKRLLPLPIKSPKHQA